MRLNNRYENAFLDEGKTTINNSRLSNGEVGIEAARGATRQPRRCPWPTVTRSPAPTQDAILIASDHTTGDPKPKLTVATSSFDTSNAGGIENDSTSVATARD